MATLGLKVPVAMGALGAGFLGLEIQAAKGLYITRKNLRKAGLWVQALKAFVTDSATIWTT